MVEAEEEKHMAKDSKSTNGIILDSKLGRIHTKEWPPKLHFVLQARHLPIPYIFGLPIILVRNRPWLSKYLFYNSVREKAKHIVDYLSND